MYLTRPIEIEVAGRFECVEDLRTFPSTPREAVANQGLLILDRVRIGAIIIRKRKQEQRAVVAHGESPDLLANFGVENIDELISTPYPST